MRTKMSTKMSTKMGTKMIPKGVRRWDPGSPQRNPKGGP